MARSTFPAMTYDLLVLLLSAVALAAPASADCTGPTWVNVGPKVPAIEAPVSAHADTGTIYIGTFGGGVLKSTDGGATFAPVNAGLAGNALSVTSLAMDPTNPDVLVITSADGGISRTVDGGASWLPTSEVGTNVVFVAVDPLDPSVWYAGYGVGGGASIRKSTDGGATWAKSDAGMPATTVWSIAVHPQRPGLVYAGTGDAGGFRSLDGGATWTPMPLPAVVWALAVDPSRPDVVYAGVNGDGVWGSTDGGATFRRIGSPGSGVVLSLLVDPDDPDRLWAGTIGTGLVTSGDGGATWKATSLRSGNVLSLGMAANGDLYAGTGSDGVFAVRRVDGARRGRHRVLPVAGEALATLEAQHVFAVSVDTRDGQRLLAATNDGGLLASRDGGATWGAAGRGFLSRAARRPVHDPRRPGRVWVGSFSGGGLHSSLNGGETWERHLFGSTGVYVWTAAVDPATGAVWAGTRGEGLWKSEDDGGTFERAAGPPLPQVRTIAFDETGTGRVFVGGNAGLFRSLDGGATFAKVTAPNTISVTVDPSNPEVVWAATQAAGVLKSVDGGATFVPKNAGLASLRMSRAGVVAIDPADGSRLWVSTEGAGVFASEDASETWSAFNDGLADLTVLGLTIDPTDPGVLYAAGPRGVWRVRTREP